MQASQFYRKQITLLKQLMQAAENIVQQEWGVTLMTMTVISVRHELLAFYERRGYHRTGQIEPFPADAGASVPLVAGLELEVLEKNLVAPIASDAV